MNTGKLEKIRLVCRLSVLGWHLFLLAGLAMLQIRPELGFPLPFAICVDFHFLYYIYVGGKLAMEHYYNYIGHITGPEFDPDDEDIVI